MQLQTNSDVEIRKITITTKMGIQLLTGQTILLDEEILSIFNKHKFGIFIKDKNNKILRLDLI